MADLEMLPEEIRSKIVVEEIRSKIVVDEAHWLWPDPAEAEAVGRSVWKITGGLAPGFGEAVLKACWSDRCVNPEHYEIWMHVTKEQVAWLRARLDEDEQRIQAAMYVNPFSSDRLLAEVRLKRAILDAGDNFAGEPVGCDTAYNESMACEVYDQALAVMLEMYGWQDAAATTEEGGDDRD